MHTVHVDLAWEWLTRRRLGHVSILVLIYWHFDLYLLLAALVDGLGETEESWMRAGCLLRDEVLMRVLVGLFDTLLVSPFDVRSDLVIRRCHRVRSAQDRAS